MLVGGDAGVGQGRPPGNSLMQEVIDISKTKSERGVEFCNECSSRVRAEDVECVDGSPNKRHRAWS